MDDKTHPIHYTLPMTTQRGFTLVELSIVLVILGLLIGGVLTGQSLIRAAELRSVTTQEARYVTATQTFRDKYFALPGDMTNATAYWGAADGSTGNTSGCVSATGTGTQTCNGNGNGQIDQPTNSNEYFRFWQHLANAGLIEGNYDGLQHGTNNTSATTANTPSGRIASSLWMASNYGGPFVSLAYAFDGQADNYLQIGGMLVNSRPVNPILKPEEVYNIDVKMDDGKPATGRIVVRGVSDLASCTDTSSTTNLSANYLLNNPAIACSIIFRQAF